MEFYRLNHDVVFEIFLHFVAMDWDGPFKLILVCNQWKDLVISKPRLWTWVAIDDTQPDWKERLHVMTHLSKELPLHVVLKLPFISKASISDILCRCITLIVDYRHLYKESNPSNPDSVAGTPYEAFQKDKATYQRLHEQIVEIINELPTRDIEILSLTHDRACFAYSTWQIYEQMIAGKSLETQLQDNMPSMITALVFKDSNPARLPRVRIQIADVWVHLSTLPHLSYLELCDNFIRMDQKSILPRICLPSLLKLAIECPMKHWVSFSFVHDTWLGLFSILDYLQAPVIENLILHGSLHRIKAVMISPNIKIRPLDLVTFITSIDEASDEQPFRQDSVWHELRRLTIDFHEITPGSFHGMPANLVELVDSFLSSFMPAGCSVRLRGSEELEAIVEASMLNSCDVDIVLKGRRLPGDDFIADPLGGMRIRSLFLGAGSAYGSVTFPWSFISRKIVIERADGLEAFLDSFVHSSGPKSFEMETLDCNSCSLVIFTIGFTSLRDFRNLMDLRCLPSVADRIIQYYDMPQLRVLRLTQTQSWEADKLKELFQLLLHGPRHIQLVTLCLEDCLEWSPLLSFLVDFNKDIGGGISTLILPGLPHPFILELIVTALGCEPSGFRPHFTDADRIPSPWDNREVGCGSCFGSGWHCYEKGECSRFSKSNKFAVTKDTTIGKYHPWSPGASM